MKSLRILLVLLFPTVLFAQVPKPISVPPKKIDDNFFNDTLFEKDNSDPQLIHLTVRNPKGVLVSQGSMKANKKAGS